MRLISSDVPQEHTVLCFHPFPAILCLFSWVAQPYFQVVEVSPPYPVGVSHVVPHAARLKGVVNLLVQLIKNRVRWFCDFFHDFNLLFPQSGGEGGFRGVLFQPLNIFLQKKLKVFRT